jgi:3-dehydroquinate synthase
MDSDRGGPSVTLHAASERRLSWAGSYSASPALPAERPASLAEDTTGVPVFERVRVGFDFPVHFTEGMFHPDNPCLVDAVCRVEANRRHRLLPIVDQGVADGHPRLADDLAAFVGSHPGRLELVAAPVPVTGGEGCKNDPAVLQRVLDLLHRHRIDRHSFVLAIGGGAVLDLVGFAAAITHRGVRLIRVPTTVLAQNDAGIGVKNGVNAYGVKNYLGTFAPPFAVINDLDFIETLEPRDKLAGMAEAVKVALIRDGAFFEWLEAHAASLARFQRSAMAWMIRRCAELHLEHIAGSGDPFEQGSARPLDYGHWSAHKLEALTRHSVRHGEAVAIGLALDTRYGVIAGSIDAGTGERVCALLEGLGFRLWHPLLEHRDETGRPSLLQGLDEFREHLGGELTVSMLTNIGGSRDVHALDEDVIRDALAWLKARDGAR